MNPNQVAKRLRKRAYEYALSQPLGPPCQCAARSDNECGCGNYVDYRDLMIDYLIDRLLDKQARFE